MSGSDVFYIFHEFDQGIGHATKLYATALKPLIICKHREEPRMYIPHKNSVSHQQHKIFTHSTL
jgi:hypothetical protein